MTNKRALSFLGVFFFIYIEFYKRVTNLKSDDVKVMLALGGWTDSSSDKYSRLVNDQAARERFIEDVIDFLLENNFDGLDLDWEFPHCWQVDI